VDLEYCRRAPDRLPSRGDPAAPATLGESAQVQHGTLRRDVPQPAITIGVPSYRDSAELTLPRILVLPFGEVRLECQTPDGARPLHRTGTTTPAGREASGS
jgi:hypothetical protein